MDHQPQQSVEVAIDTVTGELLEAKALLDLPEEAFTALRRLVMGERTQRGQGHEVASFVCMACKVPLYISRYQQRSRNRRFKHDGDSPDCPWREGRRLTPDQQKAVIYRGQQEDAEHKRIKNFIADWLEREPGIPSKVDRDAVTFVEVLRGEWKRPDVKCPIGDRQIVFEIQLSYTFLSEVIKRDEFCCKEKIHIIWVFRELDLRRSTVVDEVFFNRRNVFVLDDEAVDTTRTAGRLTFAGHFQRPELDGGGVKDVWDRWLLTLADVHFPTMNYRPYFFDHAAEKQALVSRIAQEKADQELQEWRWLLSVYLDAAVAYAKSDYSDELKMPVLTAESNLDYSSYRNRSFGVLREERFFGWHGVLPVILSIRHNRPIGFKVSTAYQVLEAGLRQSSSHRRAFTILYLWACKTFKPTLTKDQ